MDQHDFQRLFGEFAPRVRSFLLRRGLGPALADEVVQEVMLTVWNQSERFDASKGSMSTWVFTIARNRLIDSVRRQRRPEPDPLDPLWVGEREAQTITPETATANLRRAETLRLALMTLPAEQRSVLEGLYFEGLSMSELAEATGIPLGTIKTRARLALRTLRERVTNGFDQ
jgi:RNA polymerase sigma-70 factor (ECF subfamily)